VHLSHVAIAATVTFSVAGVSYAALNPQRLTDQAQVVADQATCRTVESALVAYVAVHDEPPSRISDLSGYLDGDITRYRIIAGRVAGPGC